MALSDLQIQTLARDAVQRAAAGDFAGAEPLLAQVVEARPNSGQALHLLGQARLKLGRFAEAREPLERAAKFLPKEVAAQVNLAGCLTVLGEHDAALAALDRAATTEARRCRHRPQQGSRARGAGPTRRGRARLRRGACRSTIA